MNHFQAFWWLELVYYIVNNTQPEYKRSYKCYISSLADDCGFVSNINL